MARIYNWERTSTDRLCIDFEAVQTLLSNIEKAGMSLVACDIYLPLSQQLRLHSREDLEHYSGAVHFDDVERVFFTCEDTDGHMQGSFTRNLRGWFTFSTSNEMQSFTLRGIFAEFEVQNASPTDDCLGKLPSAKLPTTQRSKGQSVDEGRAHEPIRDTLSKNRPVIEPVAIKEDITGSMGTPTPGKRTTWSKGAFISLGVLLVAVIALAPSFIQSHNSNLQTNYSQVQADTGQRQLAMEGGALFREDKLNHDAATDSAGMVSVRDFVPLDYSIQNVGRSPAVNVHMRCGGKDQHGAYLELGTIAAGNSYPLHLRLQAGDRDPLRAMDYLCEQISAYLIYDDATGHHIISFDKAGNAVPESPAKE